ncbi:hemolysin III family protein [Aspergillus saccharolyticus JOP 1030-1]|uniref:Hemolysin-III channel protein Izh2 n=1 Tax=Aspergillus saccharolyticus JOP 1030-1 TaxID=1450539 RepID=A0A318Z8A8_9EURO|nr:hemolysin-III channel protein Izh2 [Aspergillus saccharolyticus JOP 1030-1]PYH40983.1 hemolysin-III channel protein Izh2 [Aspergillus saccharolyticus JOP 1030-1]
MPKDKSSSLLSYSEIPEWYQDNKFILDSYRPVSKSGYQCLLSLVALHNETVNIYSHLVPGTFFLIAEILIYQYLCTHYPEATVADYLVFSFFLLTASLCLLISATYHTLINHSKNISNLWLRLDYIGIAILILGDFISGIYMVFYYEPLLRYVYWALIIFLDLSIILVLLYPKFQGPCWRTFRVGIFISIGLSAFAPLIHGTILFGFRAMIKQSGIIYYLAEGFILLTGAFIYTTKIPESIKPGKLDIYGSSHQLFHILVVLATVLHLLGILSSFHYNYCRAYCHL